MVALVSMTRVVQVAFCISFLIALANCMEIDNKQRLINCVKISKICGSKGHKVRGSFKGGGPEDCPCDCEKYCKGHDDCKAWFWKNGHCKYYTSYSGLESCDNCYFST